MAEIRGLVVKKNGERAEVKVDKIESVQNTAILTRSRPN